MIKKVLIYGDILAIVFGMIFICFKYYEHEKWQSVQLSNINSAITYQNQNMDELVEKVDELALQTDLEIDSAYKKISNGELINILVVGDSIGAGSGASKHENAWPTLLKKYIEQKYGGGR